MSKKATLILAALISAFTAAFAQVPSDESILRPVTSAYTLGIGSSHITDTYLSPIQYNGLNLTLGYERLQAMKFNPRHWVMQLSSNLSVCRDKNTARNATLWDLSFDFSWSMMHRWDLASVKGLSLRAGGFTSLELGAVYLARNGNNPVSAKAAWSIGATGAAIFNFNLKHLPVCLRYQPSIPITGAFFSPDYGELYYEIYLGNHRNLAHCAWFGNRFKMQNLLTADLRFGATALRVGYRADFLSSKVNNIVTRNTSHTFIIGVSGEWLSLSPSKPINQNKKIISALY